MVTRNSATTQNLQEKFRGEKTSSESKITILKGKKFEGVVLFFSFDIVGSTVFKTQKTDDWINSFQDAFSHLNSQVITNVGGAVIWRILGDEIIYVLSLKNKEMLEEAIEGVNLALVKVNRELHNSLLSFKAAAWIGNVSASEKAKYYNQSFEYHLDITHGRIIYEFIGNDIDIGFRIKQKTFSGQLFLSFELAYFLLQNGELSKKIILLGYEMLKGVWNGKSYPMIVYYDSDNGKEYIESLPYDILKTNTLIHDYYNNFRDFSTNRIKQIFDKIREEIGLNDKIKAISSTLTSTQGSLMDAMNNDYKLHMHIAVVCCDFETNEVLIARRAEERDKMPGKWEFGCAKAIKSGHLYDTVVQEYERDFKGLKMQLLGIDSRNDKCPRPYAIYEIPLNKDGNESDKGVIVYAKIINKPDTAANPEKHQEIRFLSKEELPAFLKENKNLVPDFEDTINHAFDLMEESQV